MSNHSLPARGIAIPFSHKSEVSITYEQNIICSKTLSAVICRSRGELSANEKEGKNTSYDDSVGLLQQTITWHMVAGKLIIIPALGH